MKKYLILLCVLSLPALLLGQEKVEKEKKYLFNSKKIEFTTVFVGLSPGTLLSEINSELTGVSEFRAGFILNDRFEFSYFLTGSPGKAKIQLPAYESDEWYRWISEGVYLDELSPNVGYVSFYYSGFGFAYLHKPENVLFLNTGLDIGFSGQARINEGSGLFQTNIYRTRSTALNPFLGVGLNLTNWWRVDAKMGYRFVFLADDEILSPSSYTGPTFNFGLVFGKF